ncbi:hypothetical protein CIK05_11780 [Bdellovibrio sp. qaytius]|nr:hypothetical protein CIK05_11780 [Bdellovibrio sp. qaytius]
MNPSKIPILNFFVGKQLKWNSKLTPEQVIVGIGNLPSHRLFGSGGQLVTASTSGQKFSLRCSGFGGIGMSGNAFEHIGIGKVIATTSGSEVTIYFRLRLHVFLFLIIWMTGALGGSLIILLGSTYHLITGKGNWQNSETGIIFSLFFIFFAYLFPKSCRKIAEKNEIKIVRTLTEILGVEAIE